ncbi:MAG: type II secretion system protein [Ruminococcus sp.]|nr:type II secretion system protein [Ruminococcus sp.]
MKKNKKSLKGMTLVEVLVSLAVFAMLSAILLGYGAYVDKTSKATRTMKNKVVEEAHYAAARQKEYVDAGGAFQDLDSVAGEITVTMSGTSGTFTPFIDNDPTKGYDNDHPVNYSNPSATLETDIYDTEKAYDEALRKSGYSDAEIAVIKSGANGSININFIDDNNLVITARSH